MIIIGFAAGLVCAVLRRKINEIRADDLVACLFIAAAGAASRRQTVLYDPGLPTVFELARETGYTVLEYFRDAGLVYYGDFTGAVLFVLMTAKLVGTPVWAMIDTILPSIPLMHAIGRIGCFSAGCCYGLPCGFGGLFRRFSLCAARRKALARSADRSGMPAGLVFSYASLWTRKRPPGKVLAFYLTGYGIIRFVLEFFRYDAIRGIYGIFSVSQWISLALIAPAFFSGFGIHAPEAEKGFVLISNYGRRIAAGFPLRPLRVF